MPQTTAPVTDIAARGYAHPEVLVSTQWVADHLTDPNVRLLESNEDILLYETGHIPGALKIDWVADLNDPLIRDYIDRARFEKLLRAKGINQDTTIVFYGDKNNWWATYAFWVFRLFGLERLKLLDGGRLRWADEGRGVAQLGQRTGLGTSLNAERGACAEAATSRTLACTCSDALETTLDCVDVSWALPNSCWLTLASSSEALPTAVDPPKLDASWSSRPGNQR